MSISASLNSAITGLSVTSRMTQVISSNLSNALTEGYGRRELQFSSSSFGGVSIDGVARNSDPALLGERRLADAALGSSTRSSQSLSQLESVIGTADDPFSFVARITAFEQALVSATTDPASDQRLGLVVSRLDDVTTALGDATRSVQGLRQTADSDIARDVEQLNTSLQQVDQLNDAIARTMNSGGDVAALMDQRQIAVDRISGIVQLREFERPNGAIALTTTQGTVLLDGSPAVFEFEATPTVVADMEFQNGVLGGITLNGRVMTPDTGYGKLLGGSLEASFKLRDETLPTAQFGLDEMAADLITRFESVATDPSLAPTDLGLLTDAGARFDMSNLVGMAGRIRLNTAVDPATGGDLWRLRDGVAAPVEGPVGSSTQLQNWLTSLDTRHAYDAGVAERTANERANGVLSGVSELRVRADETLSFETSRWTLLKEAELADGVDSDQELQRLLLVEQAYSANAKLIQIASSMLQRLMEI